MNELKMILINAKGEKITISHIGLFPFEHLTEIVKNFIYCNIEEKKE